MQRQLGLRLTLLLLDFASCPVVAAGAGEARRVSAPADHAAHGWLRSSASVPPGRAVAFSLALTEQNRGELLRTAAAVSDPRSPSYGRYLTQTQLDALTAPLAAHTAGVLAWLERSGVAFRRVGVASVSVRTSAEQASRLLRTSFHVLRHVETGRTIVRAGDYELPADIQGAVAAVFGLHQLPMPPSTRNRRLPTLAVQQEAAVTPAVLASTYGVRGVNVSRSVKNRHAVIAEHGEYMNSTDLTQMFADCVSDYEKGVDDRVFRFVGKDARHAYDPVAGGFEAQLDIQWIMATSPGVSRAAIPELWAASSSKRSAMIVGPGEDGVLGVLRPRSELQRVHLQVGSERNVAAGRAAGLEHQLWHSGQREQRRCAGCAAGCGSRA